MSRVEVTYAEAATNRHPHAADASSSSLIALGSGKLVCLWDAEDETDRGIYETLPGHEGLVTCVRFVQDDRFLSADDKGFVRLWRRKRNQWDTTCVTKAHEKSVSTVAVHGEVVITGASDSTVKAWKYISSNEADELKEVQTISLKGRYPLSLSVASLPGTQATILAVGSTDRNIQVWTRSEDTFVSSAVLSGHEDWVRSLAFRAPENDADPLILASGSQDATIRLWNIERYSKRTLDSGVLSRQAELSDELLDAFEASLADLTDAEEGGRQISLKRHIVTVKAGEQGPQQFSITFDALLVGHEAGVTSLAWRPPCLSTPTPTLLSTSTDSSLILWSPSTILTGTGHDGATSSIWINRQRFGDVGGQRLGGFVGGLWTRGGLEASAWGWGGGWRRWRRSDDPDETAQDPQHEVWNETGAISGHNGPVRGLSWSPRGDFLLSAGLDQTTRIHGEVPKQDSSGNVIRVWHELGRPQVHGYDLVGVEFLDNLRFVSIADEKVARVFEAPREFVEIVRNLGVADFDTDGTTRPRAATVPPLGLSNKAVNEGTVENYTYDIKRTARRPFEGELAAMTLWPEIEKVFGHGYESITLAVSNSKKFVATACKAASPEHAVVRVYDTEKWQPVGKPLIGHTLTVTQVAFSPDDNLILSVSRDRSWRLYRRSDKGFTPVAADKSHARIIWDCAWAHESDVFATASRDKTVKIWHPATASDLARWSTIHTIKTSEAATAVSFAPSDEHGRRRLAVGLESGEILVYSASQADQSGWRLDLSIPSGTAHVDQIHHIKWRPAKNGIEQLASCSEDGTLKVLAIQITGTD
ncbi:WD40 repeat-like protein [Obba rivulosa]|uniref:Elongator complex protein 2 n=1 Tax=Obba rivulosa TaxID=1052685 RepID=A0A8E2J463_9APHY|nr:WD40 repeat-like protein [Obba rivulosa]